MYVYSNDPPVHDNIMIQISVDRNKELFMDISCMKVIFDVNLTCNGKINALLCVN